MLLVGAIGAVGWWEKKRDLVKLVLLVGLLFVYCGHPCDLSIFRGFSLWFVVLLALAGVHKSVIFAGENSELNSFHLGQDCPQSF